MFKGRLEAVAAGALLLSMAPHASAVAQQAPAAGATRLEEIIVTARKREESIQSVPISITAMTGEQLRERNLQSVTDLQYAVPSLQTETNGVNRNQPNFNIRGQRVDGALMVQDPAVTTYFAGAVQAHPLGFGRSFFDLQSVQVLKGPQGTLFGRNTTGGAIVVEPNHPSDKTEFEAGIGFGNYGRKQGDAMINLPINDKIALRGAIQAASDNGMQTNLLTGQKLYREDSRAARVSLLVQPADKIQNLTIYDYFEDGGAPIGTINYIASPTGIGTASAIFGQSIRDALARWQGRSGKGKWDVESEWGTRSSTLPIIDQFGRELHNEVQNWGITNDTKLEFTDDISARNIFSWRRTHEISDEDLDGTPISGIAASTNQNIHQMSEELQLLGKSFDRRLDWVIGGFLLRENGREEAPNMNSGAVTAANIFGAPGVTSGGGINKSYAVFAQGSYHVTDDLTATAGFRWNEDKRFAYADNRNLAPGSLSNGLGSPTSCRERVDIITSAIRTLDDCALKANASFHKPTWTFSLEYHVPNIGDNALVYLTQRRGYRSGGFNMRQTDILSFGPFQPEVANDYEGGIKADWHIGDAALRTNLALFYDKFNSLQRSANTTLTLPNGQPQTVTIVRNAASSRVYGSELEVTLLPAKGVELSAFYGYLNAKYTKFESLDSSGRPIDISGTPFADTPTNKVSFLGKYTLPLDERIGEVSLQANYSYQSSYVLADADRANSTQPGYGLWNFRVQWDQIGGRNFSASAWVKNAFQKFYFVAASDLYTSFGWITAVPGVPRTFGVDLRVKF